MQYKWHIQSVNNAFLPHYSTTLHLRNSCLSLFNSPDATSIRPVTCTAGSCKEHARWLLKQEVILDELLLVMVRHGS